MNAVQYVHDHGSITNREHRTLTGISDRTATRDLGLLVERGRLQGLEKEATFFIERNLSMYPRLSYTASEKNL
ncbi:hypothetical protein KTT_56600 [Tengunoibacter tsumagoiensis]|uniref:HTH deoR-type domain-containing protein n=2 Tax=Tengunoibacter tsumagoiensis TaxID=2014871 RepID=A0A402AA67_9CHLR|nr:hypothetical protein KTT_56600 [Tengunoibacter tsumagoiensis]